jgi:hypothetical protein
MESIVKWKYKERTGRFPNVYSLNPEDMADILNTVREHFLYEPNFGYLKLFFILVQRIDPHADKLENSNTNALN